MRPIAHPLYVLCAALSVTATASAADPYRVTASALNVRSGPSTNNNKVGSLPRGAVVSVISIAGGWAKIEHNGATRYVSAQYLEKTTGGDAGAAAASAAYETTTGLNLRAGPSTNDRILTTMPQGARVTALGTQGGWLQVRYGGTTGYAYGDYLRPVAGAPAPTPTRPAPTTPTTRSHVASYRVKTPYSVARAAPSRSSAEVTTLRRGDRFRSTRSALNGYYIGFSFQGRTAWVVKTSLEREEATNALDTRTGKPTARTTYRLKSDQDLRAGPTGDKKDVKLGRVRRGQLVTGTRHYDPRFFLLRSWRLVEANGRRGWIQARHLETYQSTERPTPPSIDTRSGSATRGLYRMKYRRYLRQKPNGGRVTVRLERDTLVSARRKTRAGFLFARTTWLLVSRRGKAVGWIKASLLKEVR